MIINVCDIKYITTYTNLGGRDSLIKLRKVLISIRGPLEV